MNPAKPYTAKTFHRGRIGRQQPAVLLAASVNTSSITAGTIWRCPFMKFTWCFETPVPQGGDVQNS